jgi:hypothetical protein
MVIMSEDQFKKYAKENGIEYLGNLSFQNIVDKNAHRAYALQDNDIFSVKDISIEYEDGSFYEVEEELRIGINGLPYRKWKRTGKVFASEELNELK